MNEIWQEIWYTQILNGKKCIRQSHIKKLREMPFCKPLKSFKINVYFMDDGMRTHSLEDKWKKYFSLWMTTIVNNKIIKVKNHYTYSENEINIKKILMSF